MFAHLKEYQGNQLRVQMILGDAMFIVWSLFTLKASISTWSFIWWCQLVDLLRFETRLSSLLNIGMANCMPITKCPAVIGKAEQIQPSFSTESMPLCFPILCIQYLPKIVVSRVCFWSYNARIIGFLNRKVSSLNKRTKITVSTLIKSIRLYPFDILNLNIHTFVLQGSVHCSATVCRRN